MHDSPIVWIAVLFGFIFFAWAWNWLMSDYVSRLASDEAALRENGPTDPDSPSSGDIHTLKQ